MSEPPVPAGGPPIGHPLLLDAIGRQGNSIMITDREGGIQWVNSAFSVLTGYSREEVVGHNSRILGSGSHPREFFKELWETILAGRAWCGQIRNRRKDGTLYTEEMTIIPVHSGEQHISHFIAVKQNLRAGRQADVDLGVRPEALDWALEMSGQGLWDWNLVARKVTVNPAFRRLLGYSLEEWADGARDWFDWIHPQDRTKARRALREHLDGSPIFDAEVRLKMNDGEYLQVWSRGQAMSWDEHGRPTRIVGVHSLLSGRNKAEEHLKQAQRMAAVGLLASGVAEEVNSLLTDMNGYTEVLRHRTNLDESARESLASVRILGDRLATLLRRVHAVCPSMPENRTGADLNDVVAEFARLFGPLLPSNIQLSIDLRPRLALAPVHPDAMLQALVNLVASVAEAMPDGGRIQIATGNTEAPLATTEKRGTPAGPYVFLVVTEVGAADERVADMPDGPGLSAINKIVRQSGGWITAGNRRGTSYRICLPVFQDEAATDRKRKTVLVVEDSRDVRPFVVSALQKIGYKVLEAASRREAVEVSQNFPGAIHLLLTDVVLPDMPGQSLAQELTAARPGMAVLYMSGYPDVIEKAASGWGSEMEFIPKPFNMKALGERVNEILRKADPEVS